MTACWDTRGCDEEMRSRCPHSQPGATCPANCSFALCYRPTRKVTTDLDLLFREDMDHVGCAKDTCRSCEFFLRNAPSISVS